MSGDKADRSDKWVTKAEDLEFVALTPEAEAKAKKAVADKKDGVMPDDKDEHRAASRVLLRASHNVKSARELYRELFGIAHDSAEAVAEFSALVEDAVSDQQPTVAVPVRVALALYLRKGMGRSSGNQGKKRWHARQQRIFEKRVRARKAELKAQDVPAKKADEEILEDFRDRKGIFEPTFGWDELEPFGITENKVLRWLGRHE